MNAVARNRSRKGWASRQWGFLDAPHRLPTGQPGDQVVNHVGGERAGDACLELALGAVVEHRLAAVSTWADAWARS